MQNKEQPLLKQETLCTISRLSIPLQNDAVAREYEPQLILKNGNLVCIYPSSPLSELWTITICCFKSQLHQKPHSDRSSITLMLCKQCRVILQLLCDAVVSKVVAFVSDSMVKTDYFKYIIFSGIHLTFWTHFCFYTIFLIGSMNFIIFLSVLGYKECYSQRFAHQQPVRVFMLFQMQNKTLS